MKTLLFLLILGAGCAAAYEFRLQQQNEADYISKRAEFNARFAKLTQQNQELQNEETTDEQKISAEASPGAAATAPPTPPPAPAAGTP